MTFSRGIVMVGQMTRYLLNAHVVEAIGVQHTARGVRARQAAAVVDLGEFFEGGVHPRLRPEGKDHGGDQDQHRPVAPKKSE